MGHELETDAGDGLQFSKLSHSVVDNLDLDEAAIQVFDNDFGVFHKFFSERNCFGGGSGCCLFSVGGDVEVFCDKHAAWHDVARCKETEER